MTLSLTDPARADLRAIYAYYAESQPTSADRVIGTILKAANGLTRFPFLGKEGVVAGTRERIVTRYPYRIVYRVDVEEIVVLRVLHMAQRWPADDRSPPFLTRPGMLENAGGEARHEDRHSGLRATG